MSLLSFVSLITYLSINHIVDGGPHLSDWLSPQSLSSLSLCSQSQDGRPRLYIRATPCAVHLCARLASLALASLSLCTRLSRCVRLARLSLRPLRASRFRCCCGRTSLASSFLATFSGPLVSRLARFVSPLSASRLLASSPRSRCAQHVVLPFVLVSRLSLVSRLCLVSSLAFSPRLLSRLVPLTPNNIFHLVCCIRTEQLQQRISTRRMCNLLYKFSLKFHSSLSRFLLLRTNIIIKRTETLLTTKYRCKLYIFSKN